jgi:predicted flap endonuclease-1-like 5' DNA nuclease
MLPNFPLTAAHILQDGPNSNPILFAVIFLLLLALFIWLVLSGWPEKKPAPRREGPTAAGGRSSVEVYESSAARPAARALDDSPAVVIATPVAEEKTDDLEAVEITAPGAGEEPEDDEAVEITAPDILVEPVEPVSAEEISAEAAAAEAAAAEAFAADDLVIIEGIGPKIAAVLNQAGVTTFAQLSAMTPGQISEILHTAGMHLADPDTWPEQARLAANGDTAGLQALQERLKGGR